MRILIVDDDTTCQTLLQVFLRPYAECVVASDGREGFDKFCAAIEDNRPFDLLLLDVMMPSASGTEMLEAVREYEEEELGRVQGDCVKVIMCTALSDAVTVYNAQSSGATRYLVKPLTKRMVLDAVRSLDLPLEEDGASVG